MTTVPTRFAILAAALAIAAPLAAMSPIASQSSHYDVVLAQPTSEDMVIAGGVVFRCEGTACAGPRSRDRVLRVCSELRREVGPIASFIAGGEALPEAQLARCNG